MTESNANFTWSITRRPKYLAKQRSYGHVSHMANILKFHKFDLESDGLSLNIWLEFDKLISILSTCTCLPRTVLSPTNLNIQQNIYIPKVCLVERGSKVIDDLAWYLYLIHNSVPKNGASYCSRWRTYLRADVRKSAQHHSITQFNSVWTV